MANIVFVLGAGASAPGGCPVMSDFFDKGREELRAGRFERFRPDFERVEAIRRKLQRALAKSKFDVSNLEAVFSAIEMGIVLDGVPGASPAELKDARTSLLRLIVGTLQQTQLISRLLKNRPTMAQP